MTKTEFISAAAPLLKDRGYKKRGSYWYLSRAGYVFCINLQGSQWDKDHYYINIGAAEQREEAPYPTLLKWLWRHRCRNAHGEELNPELSDLLLCIDSCFSDFLAADDPSSFYKEHHATLLVNQYWL